MLQKHKTLVWNPSNIKILRGGNDEMWLNLLSHMSDTHRALVWTVQRPGYVLYMTQLLMAGQYNGQWTTACGWHAELLLCMIKLLLE
jgi:hypothetical protein